ncbi:ornithine cyclodeaminase family protein [Brevundimonas diminuta]|uniref:ornithine cyclodeaminase family protein n=1 Tax=Brevundimonas diminuta TaxID=293 RepID=UPI0037CB180C
MRPPFYSEAEVEAVLDYAGGIEAVQAAMTALSLSERDQPLRQILGVGEGLFGLMPGSLASQNVFGAKLVSVFGSAGTGRARHQGVVVAFNAETGAVDCMAEAEAVTQIRTACASAAATRALARADARVLSVFGLGAQAESHVRALSLVRPFERIQLWGRDAERAESRARALALSLGLPVTAVASAEEAARSADVICTVTGSATPVVLSEWVADGTHLNLVGSSYLGPVEVDAALVVRSRYVADYLPSVLAQASELAVAREAGMVDDAHVVGEIGQVFAGRLPGRHHAEEVTLYKSLGHVVQDLAAVRYVHSRAGRGSGEVA